MGNGYDRLLRYDVNDPSQAAAGSGHQVERVGRRQDLQLRVEARCQIRPGNALTAEDVVFSLQRAVLLDKTPAFILTQFGLTKDNVKDKVKQTGPLTLTIETDKPYAPTLVYNCLTANVASVVDKKLVMSKEAAGDMGYAWLKTNYAGSGPLKIREWRANEIVTLERNDNYYGTKIEDGARDLPAREGERHPAPAAGEGRRRYRAQPDARRIWTALAANKDVKTTATPKGTVYYFSLNQKNPILAKPEVREAFKWLVDYAAIGDTIIKNIGVVHQNFLPIGLLGASKENPYKLDVAKAKALLAKAGHANGFKVTIDMRTHAAGAGHHRSRAADAEAGGHRARDPARRRQADADEVPRAHARHLHRPVGRRLLGPAHQRRHLRPQPEQRATTRRASRWPGAMPGTFPS